MAVVQGPAVAVGATGEALAMGPPGPQGKQGPPGPAGANGASFTWTVLRVAGAGSTTAVANSKVFADPAGAGGGSPTVAVIVSPNDGDEFVIKDTTGTCNATTQKIGIDPTPQSLSIEDPQNPGHFVTVKVFLVQPGASARFAWDAGKSHFALIGS